MQKIIVMRKLLLAGIATGLLCLTNISSDAQGKFSITGKLKEPGNATKVHLSYSDQKKYIVDSAEIVNGTFRFSGTLHHPVRATIVLNHGANSSGSTHRDMTYIYIEPGNIELAVDDSIKHVKVKGSKSQQLYESFTAGFRKHKIERDSYASIKGTTEEQFVTKFIKQHPDSYLSLQTIQTYLFPIPVESELLDEMYQSLSPKLKNSEEGKEVGKLIRQIVATSVGKMAPNFALKDTAGNMVSLTDFRGQYILVDFWASWCHPCRDENPNLLEAYKKYRAKNFNILGITYDINEKNWLKAIHEDGLLWPQVIDSRDKEKAAGTIYSVQAIPQNFLVDPSGKIIAKNLRGKALEAVLSKIL